MSSEDLAGVTEQLAKTKVHETFELSFKGKGLKLNTADDAKEIVDEIEKCPNMTALRMEGNTMGVDAAAVIAGALVKHPEFERALWSDMFTGRLKTEIPQALKHLGAAIISAGAGLVELDLSDNAFGPTGVEGLVTLLKSSSCYTLKELKLNNNGLGVTGGKMLAQCLLDCHQNSCADGQPLALRVFISGRGRLENDGATALAKAFKAIGTLEHVSMPQNGINHQGVTALAEAFAANTNLKVLNLNDNTFTETGAKSMAKVLQDLQNLEVINFGDCLIRTDGAKAVANALTNGHRKLRELILCGNEIGQSGANAIAESLEDKELLDRLDLDANQLGEEGCEVLKGSMEAIGKLEVLGSLSGDEGSDEEDEEEEDLDKSDEDEGSVDEEEGEVIDDPELQVRGKAISPAAQVVSAKDFLAFPSPTKLFHMGKHRASAIRQELGDDIHDVDKAVQTYMRVSSVVTADDERTRETACECADEVLEEIFKHGGESAVAIVANSLLVHLGVLKGEDKKYRPPSDITGPLLVLEHAVAQTYFPKFARDILQAFLSKPHPVLEKSQARHKLLQTLYSF